ncbi:MAG: DUF2232 domain-containing protein [Acidobacteriota bacterium]
MSPRMSALRHLGPGVAGLFSLLVFLSFPLLPLLGFLVALLAPLPLVHLTSTGRPAILAWGWVTVVLLGAALIVHDRWLLAIAMGYLLLAAWPAQTVESWLRREWKPGRWAAVVAGGGLVLATGFMVGLFFQAAPYDGLAAVLTRTAGEAQQIMQALGPGGSSGEELVARSIGITAYLAPSLAALYLLWGAMWLRPRLAALGLPRGGEHFDTFASEEWLPVGFIVGGLGWVFAGGSAKWFAANLLVTVLGLYFVHGLAIIHFYLGRRLSGNRWVRLGVMLFALQLPVALVLSLGGLVDAFFPLRRGGSDDGGTPE